MKIYQAKFVDLKILHALSEHGKQGIESTVIYAGGAHGEGIRPTLMELGYKLKKFVTLSPKDKGFFKLKEALHRLDPEYDSDTQLSKTIVDYLLTYIEFEHEHPNLAIVIPTTILIATFSAIGYLAQSLTCGSKS